MEKENFAGKYYIKIFGTAAVEIPSSHCNICGSFGKIEEYVAELASILKQKYGDQVEVKFIDIFLSPEIDAYKEILFLALTGQVQLPIVTINDQVRLSGNLSMTSILDELESIGLKPPVEH